MDWGSVLPQLSVGVVSVLSLVYVVLKFLDALREERKALREVEKEIRSEILQHLTISTSTVQQAVKVIERLNNHLDKT